MTLPDICGGIAFPELVKRGRDGRILRDRSGEPSRDTGRQYSQWVDTYGAPFLKKDPADEAPYICGERLWQLRCEYLHQNKGFDNDTPDTEVRFHLGLNCGSSICNLDTEDGSDIRLDIEELCRRICLAARSFYEENRENMDFALYNTPVIDFTRWKEEAFSARKVLGLCRRICLAARSFYEENRENMDFALYNTPVIDFTRWKEEAFSARKVLGIVTGDRIYGSGLKAALGQYYRLAVSGVSWEEVRKKLKKEKPDVWILDREFLKYVDHEDGDGKGPAVFILKEPGSGETVLEGYLYLDKFMDLKEMRRTIRSGQEGTERKQDA